MASPLSPTLNIEPSMETPGLLNAVTRRPLQREGAHYFLTPTEQAMEDAMTWSSPAPEPVLGKRTHPDEPTDGNNTEPDDGLPLAVLQHPLQSIGNDSVLGQQAKLFIQLIRVENKLDALQSAAPPYTPSEDLKTNINNYSIAVMLSVNISAYKGDIPRNHVLMSRDILKKYHFDLPPGIEHDYANWEKITGVINYSLTQAHVKCNGSEKLWNFIDQRLEFIQNRAGLSKTKAAKVFNEILKVDRGIYGADDEYEIKEVVADEWQQCVDDMVAGVQEVTITGSGPIIMPIAVPAVTSS
ncbi:hypothetical protein CPB84DRAFT_1940300 [Gymnopilus junonius]|uniref:Uncharacterized protein n=1 Tax=Gymnopilus junonius TaxID=109634 RepID=A0A9P5TK01_GYMJU|nr:hypothetical protein CPB84DRAFT_1940300 [Gymnopilus junonius]